MRLSNVAVLLAIVLAGMLLVAGLQAAIYNANLAYHRQVQFTRIQPLPVLCRCNGTLQQVPKLPPAASGYSSNQGQETFVPPLYPTTTINQQYIHNYYSTYDQRVFVGADVSSISPMQVNITSINTSIVFTSNISITSNTIIAISYIDPATLGGAPKNYTALYSLNISIKSNGPVSAYVVSKYPGALYSYASMTPFTYKNGSWKVIPQFTVNTGVNTISYPVPHDAIVLLGWSAQGRYIPPTTIPTTTIGPYYQTFIASNLELLRDAAIIIGLLAIATAYYYYSEIRRHHNGHMPPAMPPAAPPQQPRAPMPGQPGGATQGINNLAGLNNSWQHRSSSLSLTGTHSRGKRRS